MQYKAKAKAKVVHLAPRRQAKESALSNQAARTLHRQDTAHLVHGFVPLRDHQETGAKIFVKGSGVYLWDAEGKKYIDGLASLWNVHVGHGRKEIAKAAAEQMETLAYAPTLIGPTSVPTVQLAAKLVKLAPKDLTRVIFTSGGSESTETIIRLIRFYWQARGQATRTKIVSLNMGYHGSSSGAASITGIPTFYQAVAPGLPGVHHIARPYCYRCELGKPILTAESPVQTSWRELSSVKGQKPLPPSLLSQCRVWVGWWSHHQSGFLKCARSAPVMASLWLPMK